MENLQATISTLYDSDLWKISAKIAQCEADENAEHPANGNMMPRVQNFWAGLHELVHDEIQKRKEK